MIKRILMKIFDTSSSSLVELPLRRNPFIVLISIEQDKTFFKSVKTKSPY